jgi:hypothetical protein
MTVTKIKRMVNPQKRRRNMSAKQIKHFGTKRQRAALKAANKRKRSAAHRPAKRAANPAHVLTLGLVNPERSKSKRKTTKGKNKSMATKKQLAALRKARAAKKRSSHSVRNPRKHRRAVMHASNPRRRNKRRNSTKIYVLPRKHNRMHNGRRRNPDVFGLKGMQAGKAILAGLVGVYATKTITPMVATAVPQVGSSPIFSAILSAVIAWGGGALITKWDKTIGEGFMFGGFMQAGSQLLNLVVPSNPISLSGLGDWVSISPTGFPVPSNDIMRAMLARQGAALPPPSAPATPAAGMGVAAMFR